MFFCSKSKKQTKIKLKTHIVLYLVIREHTPQLLIPNQIIL